MGNSGWHPACWSGCDVEGANQSDVAGAGQGVTATANLPDTKATTRSANPGSTRKDFLGEREHLIGARPGS
jgi:hypothetical protein